MRNRNKSPEQNVIVNSEAKTRKCLICRRAFESAWAGERICRRCKATSAWRSG